MNFFWIAIGIIIIAFAVYKIAVNSFTDYFLGNATQKIKAVIIDHKNYLPNQRVKAEFTYSYQFGFNGKKYTGNSHDETLKIGNSIVVEFNRKHPNISKPFFNN